MEADMRGHSRSRICLISYPTSILFETTLTIWSSYERISGRYGRRVLLWLSSAALVILLYDVRDCHGEIRNP